MFCVYTQKNKKEKAKDVKDKSKADTKYREKNFDRLCAENLHIKFGDSVIDVAERWWHVCIVAIVTESKHQKLIDWAYSHAHLIKDSSMASFIFIKRVNVDLDDNELGQKFSKLVNYIDISEAPKDKFWTTTANLILGTYIDIFEAFDRVGIKKSLERAIRIDEIEQEYIHIKNVLPYIDKQTKAKDLLNLCIKTFNKFKDIKDNNLTEIKDLFLSKFTSSDVLSACKKLIRKGEVSPLLLGTIERDILLAHMKPKGSKASKESKMAL